MKFDISTGLKTFKSVITANSPVLLAGAAIAGVTTTGILAARAGYKARGIIDNAELAADEPLDTLDKFKLTWLCYVGPAATGVSTIASVAGVHLIHTKRHAALAGLYAMTTAKLDDVSDKAEELLGPKKAQQLKNEVAQSGYDRGPGESSEVIITGDGTSLTYDELSGRTFLSSINKIDAAVNRVNAQLASDDNVCLNDLYDYLNLDPIKLGDRIGWSGQMISPQYGAIRTSDGQAANTVSFLPAPTADYRKRG